MTLIDCEVSRQATSAMVEKEGDVEMIGDTDPPPMCSSHDDEEILLLAPIYSY